MRRCIAWKSVCSGFVMVGALTAGTSAYAATVSYSHLLSGPTTLHVSAFDTRLGALERVTLEASISLDLRSETSCFGLPSCSVFSEASVQGNLLAGDLALSLDISVRESKTCFADFGGPLTCGVRLLGVDAAEASSTDPSVLAMFSQAPTPDFMFTSFYSFMAYAGEANFDGLVKVTYQYAEPDSGNDVPEPTSLALTGVALAAAAATGWRRRPCGTQAI